MDENFIFEHPWKVDLFVFLLRNGMRLEILEFFLPETSAILKNRKIFNFKVSEYGFKKPNIMMVGGFIKRIERELYRVI